MAKMSKNNSHTNVFYDNYILVRQNKFNEVASKHGLTPTDRLVFLEAVNNTYTNSCKISITMSKLMEKCGITTVSRHTKRLIDAGLLKRVGNVFYVNPDIARKGNKVKNSEYKMFGCTCNEDYKNRKNKQVYEYEEDDISDIGF